MVFGNLELSIMGGREWTGVAVGDSMWSRLVIGLAGWCVGPWGGLGRLGASRQFGSRGLIVDRVIGFAYPRSIKVQCVYSKQRCAWGRAAVSQRFVNELG